MGNTVSLSDQPNPQPPNELYQSYGIEIIPNTDMHYSDKSYSIPSDSSRYIFQKDIHYMSKEAISSMKPVLQKRTQLHHSHLLDVVEVIDASSGDWCSQFSILRVYMEMFRTTLSNKPRGNQELEGGDPRARSTTYKQHSETDMIGVLRGVSAAQVYLHEQMGYMVHDIHPSTLFFDQQERVRISDSSAYHPEHETGYLKMLRDVRHRAPLSPEQFGLLASHGAGDPHDKEKSSVYALGMVVLSAVHSVPFEMHYDFDSFRVDGGLVHERVTRMVEKGYSRYFQGLLGNMLNSDPQRRPTFAEIMRSIKKNTR